MLIPRRGFTFTPNGKTPLGMPVLFFRTVKVFAFAFLYMAFTFRVPSLPTVLKGDGTFEMILVGNPLSICRHLLQLRCSRQLP